MLDKIHRLPSALAITGLCRTALYDRLKEGQFPEPVRIGPRAIGWRESDLATWVNTRAKRSTAKS
jgi:prophage regulatory protein